MNFLNERHDIRQFFYDAWQKHLSHDSVNALEAQIIQLIHQHPEYHTVFSTPESLTQEYSTDNNPFLHLGLHLSLTEQLATNRPEGITALYEKLCHTYKDPHQVEHLMIEVMANLLWDSQQHGQAADQAEYLSQLKKLR